MNKLKMESKDRTQENFERLAALFPNAVTETIDENGAVVRAIDKDVLQQEISAVVVEGRDERYQFTWPDKKKSILAANAPIRKTLRPCREESVNFDTTENLYIEGDNLDVLKLLQETYLGRVKMIYIDPPYNTGHDFVYNDDFKESTDEYMENSGQLDDEGNRLFQNTESNGRFHTDWLNMLYPRLKIARDLLSDDGVIFISIDDNEVDNLKKMCNEVFGESNLVAEIPWQSRASMQNDTDFSINHEYICVYAKRRRMENRRLKETNYNEWHKKDSFVCKPLPLKYEKFDNPDNDPRGPWKADPFDAPNVRPNLTYAIINPNTGEEHWPPHGRHWRTEEKNYKKWLDDGRIVWTNEGKGRPQLKVFYEEKKEYGSVDNSWFSADRIGTITNGTKELMNIFNGISIFDNPKPISMLMKLVRLANFSEGDVLLDFFSGSASSAHAVIRQNFQDVFDGKKGKRKFIMVQLPEPCDEKSEAYKAGYKNICEIGKERIKRAGELEHMNICGISGSSMRWNEKRKAELGDKYVCPNDVDTGFRVLKLDSTNMKDVYYNPHDVQMSILDDLADNIKEDRTPEDLLFQVMLDLGILLSSKIEESEIAGKKVFSVADNFLIACFDEDVSDETITAVAKSQPAYFVMRDSSMKNDSVATNFDQIFATYSPDTVRKVI